jgi:two-component system, OmpR family, sensor histidine kinase KdpD
MKDSGLYVVFIMFTVHLYKQIKVLLKGFLFNKPPKKRQYAISICAVVVVVAMGLGLAKFIDYRNVALILLVVVSVLAMFLDIKPVLLAATLSALAWDFFFIPPRFTLTIGETEDRVLIIMYFVVALVSAVLTFKIRQMEKEVREKEERAKEVKFYNTLFNSLSHELRTPITTIIGATDNLMSQSSRLDEATRSELLSEVSIAALRLNQQVENLLSMSRLESGVFQIKKDWVDIDELIHKVVHHLEPQLLRFRTSIDIDHNLPLFKLDFGIMEQVLYNLIYNAVIHTPENTTITIQAQYIDQKLVMKVADNGRGFPPEEFENVFTKFYQPPGSKGGTGLGLSIVKGFVEAHNGKIRIENLPVCGAMFTIEIDTEVSYPNKIKDA